MNRCCQPISLAGLLSVVGSDWMKFMVRVARLPVFL